MHMHMHIHIHIYTHMHMHIFMYRYRHPRGTYVTHLSLYLQMRRYMRIEQCMTLCIHVSTYIHLSMNLHV